MVMATAVPAAAAQVDATAMVATDNRFRGVSLSNRRSVATVDATATFASGWFAAVSVASLGEARNVGAAGGRTPEIDVSAGWSRSMGLLTPAVGVIGYTYPGGRGGDYAEGFASLAGALGPLTTTVGVNYAPAQGNLRRDNVYAYLSPALGLAGTPLTLRATLGYERGALQGGARAKVDYAVGVSAKVGRALTVTARWGGNDLGARASDPRAARAAATIGVGVTF